MTDREKVLADALRAVVRVVGGYRETARRGAVPVGLSILVLDAIGKDAEKALDEVGEPATA